jgi:hypothetical protein
VNDGRVDGFIVAGVDPTQLKLIGALVEKADGGTVIDWFDGVIIASVLLSSLVTLVSIIFKSVM